MPALQMLLYGPWGVPFGLYQWFANPLLVLAVLAHRRFRRLALLLGVCALYRRSVAWVSSGCRTTTAMPSGRHRLRCWLLLVEPGDLVFCLGQAWWCWKARRADDMPGWHWLDVALIAAIAVTMYAGTQMPALHFDVDKVLMPPESSQSL